MLNIRFEACTIGPDSLHCGKWGKFLNTYSDLDLDPTKLNIELVRVIFYSNEYPIVEFSKNATIIINIYLTMIMKNQKI